MTEGTDVRFGRCTVCGGTMAVMHIPPTLRLRCCHCGLPLQLPVEAPSTPCMEVLFPVATPSTTT